MSVWTLGRRAYNFQQAFPNNSAAWFNIVREAGHPVMIATWIIGNDFRNRSPLYGTYPPGLLERVYALFPDVMALANFEDHPSVLHVFSGDVPPDRRWVRLDINPERHPDVVGNVYDAYRVLQRKFKLICADPPYSRDDAKRYGTGPVNRRRAFEALADVAEAGGHMAWLDTCWPMHNKKQWVTVGRITVIRATNHRVRLLSIFERQ